MATETIEERLTRLEEQVARLQAGQPERSSETPWWKKVVGIYRNDAEFDAAEQSGRAYRESLRPEDDTKSH